MEDLVSTILFVDDHHAFRTVFAEVLRNDGHTVLEAGTTADAEHILERHSGPIDLLIAEAVLTTTNGLEVVQRIQPLHREMRILYISEESGSSLTQEGLVPKGAHFLHKPFEAEQLMTALQNLPASRQTASKSSRARQHSRGKKRAKGHA
jgi:two-component system, cell cycle sensor histidine kinase and response regulator CckA